jgi:hypothetical protein
MAEVTSDVHLPFAAAAANLFLVATPFIFIF